MSGKIGVRVDRELVGGRGHCHKEQGNEGVVSLMITDVASFYRSNGCRYLP